MNRSVEGATVISRHIKVAAKRLPELRDQPAYHLTDAAAYVRLPVATLRSWVSERSYATNAGRKRAEPLIVPADRTQRILSFNNLVEAHILRAFRRTHNLQMSEVRKALMYASHHLGIPRLLRCVHQRLAHVRHLQIVRSSERSENVRLDKIVER